MPSGEKYKKDFWGTEVNEMNSLLKLLRFLKQYIKHPKRYKDLINAEQNLVLRIGEETND